MTKVTLRQWVDALKSGEYKQTCDTLKEEFKDGTYGYCCLGVLASISGKEPPSHHESRRETYEFNEGPQEIYDWIRDWFEANELPSYLVTDLISLNDMSDDFSEVINHLEEHL